MKNTIYAEKMISKAIIKKYSTFKILFIVRTINVKIQIIVPMIDKTKCIIFIWSSIISINLFFDFKIN